MLIWIGSPPVGKKIPRIWPEAVAYFCARRVWSRRAKVRKSNPGMQIARRGNGQS